ncbi:MAG TPA: OmpA family protein [Leeuwenhoekiella sp.]|nr:OmpA family protein [Leeuwenhoekiella sp.]
MKKILLGAFAILGIMGISNAQDMTDQETMMSDDQNTVSSYDDYNRWSIDINAGVNKPSRPFAPGYYTSTPDFFHADAGLRYMINDRAGLKVDFGFDNFSDDEESLPFKSRMYRISLQGVANAGNILGFREWTNTLGLLLHGGMGYSRLSVKEPVELDDNDQMLNFIAGITPQIKLADRVALNADLSVIGNIRQDQTFDGTARQVAADFDGFYVNATIGISVYLGGNDVHADWYSREKNMATDLDSINNRLAKLENDLQDTDRDGVPNYLDREPDTVSGVTVDTKGVAVDKNKNGIPDELESSLEAKFNKMEATSSSSGNDIIEKLIDDGYVNVYFQFNSTQPEVYSYEAINYLTKYMKENTDATAELIGYADEIGNPNYNKALSEKRAQKVFEILVASGVDGERLNVTGSGEDTSVDKNSSAARQLVRRVTFKLVK